MVEGFVACEVNGTRVLRRRVEGPQHIVAHCSALGCHQKPKRRQQHLVRQRLCTFVFVVVFVDVKGLV